MTTNFAIFRREKSGGYSPRGPVALVMSLEQARREIARLRASYPYQDFVIMGEVGENCTRSSHRSSPRARFMKAARPIATRCHVRRPCKDFSKTNFHLTMDIEGT
jgi:hypothetical protein